MSENPKCPYCGGEMRYAFNGDIVGTHFLICETCLSRSPAVSFNDDPYAAAMKRDRANEKGYLVYRAGHHWEEDGTDYPDICVYVNGYCPECGQVLCRVSEKTIRYPEEFMYTDKSWDYKPELIRIEDEMIEAAVQKNISPPTNFCPNCGADMLRRTEQWGQK